MNTMPILPGHKIPSKSILPIYALILVAKISGKWTKPKRLLVRMGSKVKIVTLINIIIVKTGN